MMEQQGFIPPYIPESQTELDGQLLRFDSRYNFTNKKLGAVLSDDIVRSYLDEYQIKALTHLMYAYEALTDASTGKYTGVFDNASEMVLVEIQFIINIARSKEGINIRTIKGRSPLEEFRKNSLLDKLRPFQGNQSGQQFQDMPSPNYQDQNYQQYRSR